MARTVILPTLAHSSSNSWWYFLANLMNLRLSTSSPNLSRFWLTRGLILTTIGRRSSQKKKQNNSPSINLGHCHRLHQRCPKSTGLQNLPPVPWRTREARQIYQRKPQKELHLSLPLLVLIILFLCGKKDGKLCPVVDYQKLNSFTIPDWYPVLLIQELVNKV